MPPKKTQPRKKENNKWRRTVRGLLLAIDIAAVAALAATGYAGMLSPLTHNAWVGVLPLGFPIMFWVVAVLLVFQLFWHRRGAVLCAAGMLICAGPCLSYFPLNFLKNKIPEGAETFTLMSYNTHQFWMPGGKATTDGSDNPTLQYIIDSGVDVVCLQEATTMHFPDHFGAAQLDTLHSIYPYVLLTREEITLFSKYPVEAVHLDVNKENFPGGSAGCFRITLPSGRAVTVFDVHLQSFRLDPDDKEVYLKLTELKGEDFDAVRSQLLAKIKLAAIGRARDIQQLMRYIRLYGGPDVIVTGDFNDVTNCYAIHTLENAGFKDVFTSVGLGPMITYNQDRFYFCIDHTLYRGDIAPLAIRKDKIALSDHYPVITTFAVK